jgi:hypothetical protein
MMHTQAKNGPDLEGICKWHMGADWIILVTCDWIKSYTSILLVKRHGEKKKKKKKGGKEDLLAWRRVGDGKWTETACLIRPRGYLLRIKGITGVRRWREQSIAEQQWRGGGGGTDRGGRPLGWWWRRPWRPAVGQERAIDARGRAAVRCVVRRPGPSWSWTTSRQESP